MLFCGNIGVTKLYQGDTMSINKKKNASILLETLQEEKQDNFKS